MEKTEAAPAKSSNMPKKKARNYGYEFYRNNFRRMVIGALCLVILDILLVLALFFVFSTQSPPALYATTRSGLLVKLRVFDSLNNAVHEANALKAAKSQPSN